MRSRSPSRSSGRERKSIQTRCPCSDSWCSRDVAIGTSWARGRDARHSGYRPHLVAIPAVTSEQLLILGLLAAAFAAGWFARGGRAERPAGESEREADGGEAAVAPAAPQAGDDALVAEADEELR